MENRIKTEYFDAKILTSKFFCRAKENSRYAISGLFVEIDSNGLIRATSTDGHRLHQIEQNGFVDMGEAWFKENDHQAILPRFKLPAGIDRLAISWMKGSALIQVSYGKIHKKYGKMDDLGSLTVHREIDRTFPPYRQVIPNYGRGDYLTINRLSGFRADFLADAARFLGDFGLNAQLGQAKEGVQPMVLTGRIKDGDKPDCRGLAVIMPTSLE